LKVPKLSSDAQELFPDFLIQIVVSQRSDKEIWLENVNVLDSDVVVDFVSLQCISIIPYRSNEKPNAPKEKSVPCHRPSEQ
jgi:hypothetical protein